MPDNNIQQDLSVVYKANATCVQQVLDALRAEGFDAVALENPQAATLYRSAWHYWINIAVPAEQKAAAEIFLKNWELQKQRNVEQITSKIKSHFISSVIIVFAAAIILLAVGIVSEILFPVLFLVWFASFVFLANIDKFRKKSDSPSEPEDILRGRTDKRT